MVKIQEIGQPESVKKEENDNSLTPHRTCSGSQDEALCVCEGCFHEWWDTLSDTEKAQMSYWTAHIQVQVPGAQTRKRSNSEPMKSSTDIILKENETDVEIFEEVQEMDDWNGYGERLYDDSIDIFCDRIQKAAQARNIIIEGCLAIQYVHAGIEELKNVISGNHLVLQVIFDETRTGHFLLVEWTPRERKVIIYDSLFPEDGNVNQTMTDPVIRQIKALFGHLYNESPIPVQIELNLEHQNDGWSCGLRVIGFLTRLVIGLPATYVNYNLEQLSLMMAMVRDGEIRHFEDFLYIYACAIPFELEERSIFRYPLQDYIGDCNVATEIPPE